jgi:HAD superfamily hydrolase (TIGR01509 family)
VFQKRYCCLNRFSARNIQGATGIPIQLVIFDCDGVVIDSEVISARVLIAHLASIGVSVDIVHCRTHFLGRSFPKVAAEVRETYGIMLPDDFESSYRATLLKAFDIELQPMAGIVAVLKDLAVASCIATSSSPPRARHSLELTGLLSHFHGRIYTASEVAKGKPAPDLFLHAAQQMGVEPENCLVIEDSVPGIKAALAAGMRVLHFTGGSHLKGIGVLEGLERLNVPAFDNWANFFDIEPELRGRALPAGAAGSAEL